MAQPPDYFDNLSDKCYGLSENFIGRIWWIVDGAARTDCNGLLASTSSQFLQMHTYIILEVLVLPLRMIASWLFLVYLET